MLCWPRSARTIARYWDRSGASEYVHGSKLWFYSADSSWARHGYNMARQPLTSHSGGPASSISQVQHCCKVRTLRDLGSSQMLSPLWHFRAVQYSSSAKPGDRTVQRQNRNTALYMVAVVAGMIGFTYFSVPLYRIFCAATGYGGTVAEGKTVESKLKQRISNPDVATEQAAANRMVTVNFVSEVQPGLKWSFTPCQKAIKVRPGQSTLVFYTAENTSDDHLTAVSTYNVAPPQVGKYFNKIQCFCFEEQHLRPRESVDMPVFFYIDPEFATDRRLKNVDHITLSYVFFRTGEVPTHADGTELTPGESMPAYLLPSQQAVKSGMQVTVENTVAKQETVDAKVENKTHTESDKTKPPPVSARGSTNSNVGSSSSEPVPG